MAWSIEKKFRIQKYPPYFTRWDWNWCISCYGAAIGSAVTKRGAEKALAKAEYEMMAGQFR
jgi:hypothetical protein